MASQEIILQVSLISVLFSVYSSVLSKKFIFTPEYVKQMEMQRKINKELMEARKRGDSKALKKLEKKYEMVTKLAQKALVKTFVLIFISFASFMVLFNLMNPIYAQYADFMTLPIPIPFIGEKINYLTWFIITSILCSRVLSKALKMG